SRRGSLASPTTHGRGSRTSRNVSGHLSQAGTDGFNSLNVIVLYLALGNDPYQEFLVAVCSARSLRCIKDFQYKRTVDGAYRWCCDRDQLSIDILQLSQFCSDGQAWFEVQQSHVSVGF